MNDDEDKVMLQIPMPKKEYYQLLEMKGTKRSWTEFLIEEVLK